MRIKSVLLTALAVFATSLPVASAAPIYVFPVVGCKVTYAHSHHDYAATDILAKSGCKYVAPIGGTITEVATKDLWNSKKNLGDTRGGLSVTLVGDDGVRYYGSHFKKIETGIEPGVVVVAGQTLAYVGATGSARGTAPHVHFGISWPTPVESNVWWVRRGVLYPWSYLDAWKVGTDKSPFTAVEKLRKKLGDVPPAPKK
ncbi:MAG: peptidoglycan DD-metalloendopeptidase family protein [Actinobacteria bacterium]|nr:peptidoglycan DD-metalloendopeptidase family protein [Actinomycetota bacterium]